VERAASHLHADSGGPDFLVHGFAVFQACLDVEPNRIPDRESVVQNSSTEKREAAGVISDGLDQRRGDVV